MALFNWPRLARTGALATACALITISAESVQRSGSTEGAEPPRGGQSGRPSLPPTPTDVEPGSITYEHVPYPYPVKFVEFETYGEPVRMAYMDVAPAGAANGKTVVLFHGMNFAGYYWGDAMERLRREGFRVLALDQIGFGRSSKPVIPYHFQDMALNTKRVLDHLELRQVMIVGHSMGGMLAARFAAQYPDVVERVVIYNPIGVTDQRYSGRPWSSTDEAYQRTLRSSYQSYYASMQRYFSHDPNAWKPEYEKFARYRYATTLSSDWPRFAQVLARIQQMPYLDPVVYDWAHIKAPTLAYGGREDGPGFAERMKFIADSVPNGNGRVHLLPGLGHVPHFEDPERFYPPLIAFLKESL